MTPTLIELWIGNTFWCIIFAASGVWFCENKIAYLLGVAFGWLASLGLTFYMARSIRLLVDDLDEGRGDRRIRSSSLIRLLIAGAVIAIACVVPFLNPIGTFLGIFSTKLAAYCNPIIHRITKSISPYFADKEYPEEELTEETPEALEAKEPETENESESDHTAESEATSDSEE